MSDRMQLADAAAQPSPATTERGPAGMEGRVVGERLVRRARRSRGDAASSSMRPLASSRSYGRAGRSQAGISAAPVSDEPEPPPLVGAVALVAGAVALADLEDRDVVAGPDGRFVGHDLEEAAEQALAHDRVLARQRVGDRDRPAAGLAFPGDGRVVDRPEPLDHRRRHERGRDGLGQARARQRLADGIAEPSGRCR